MPKKEPMEDLDNELDAILGATTPSPKEAKQFKERVKEATESPVTEHDEMEIDSIKIPEILLRVVPNEAIDDLAASIKNDGLFHPILVTKDGMLVAGYRRLLAHRKLKLDSIQVRVVDFEGIELYRVAGVENIQRLQLSREEQAKYYTALLADKKKYPNQKAVAKAIGISETKVSLSLNAVGEGTAVYSADVQEKRDAKKAEKKKAEKKAATHKYYPIDERNLPKGITITVSKTEINVAFKIKIQSEKHAKSMVLLKEATTVLKEVDNKEFVTEMNILRGNA